jgi:hypothetical protein
VTSTALLSVGNALDAMGARQRFEGPVKDGGERGRCPRCSG